MLKQLQMGLRAFLLLASRIWTCLCFMIRKQTRAVSNTNRVNSQFSYFSERCSESANRFLYGFIDESVCFDILTSRMAEKLIRDKTRPVLLLSFYPTRAYFDPFNSKPKLKLPKY